MISSTANAQIKYLVKLQEKNAVRKKEQVYVCEGQKMFLEVLQYARKDIVKAYFSESFYREYQTKNGFPNLGNFEEILSKIPFEVVADAVFREISQTVTPQGVLAVVRQPEYSLEMLMGGVDGQSSRLLLLEDLRDPGNLGTILRTAEGAGMTGVILSRESVDMFNPKVIRSTMGAIYRVPFIYVQDFIALLDQLKVCGFTVYAAHLAGAVEYDIPRYPARTAMIIGNEANGLSETAAQRADARIRIPMAGKVESLNAAVAAAILMYEIKRQERENMRK
jgi:TrmH family RNA methyltransferase